MSEKIDDTAKATVEEDGLFAAILAYIDKGEVDTAISRLDDIAAVSKIPCFYLGMKCKLQRQLGRNTDAMVTIQQGLRIDPNDHTLLQQKAELIFESAQSIPLIDEAISLIERAENMYDRFESRNKIENYVKDVPGLQSWIINLIQNRSTITATKFNMKATRRLYELLAKTEELETKVESEKVRQFEQLALFSTVIALIITNVQLTPRLDLAQIIILNISLVLALTLSLSLGSMVIDVGNRNRDPLLKQWRFWLSVTLILAGIILYMSVK